jgi:hypothetical protein
MLTRTLRSSVTFQRPFRMKGADGVQPAGTYSVDAEEELIEGISFAAYRRVSTMLMLETPGRTGVVQAIMVDQKDLDAALTADRV